MLLTDADLAYMQATQMEAMPGTVIIQRYSAIDNGMGGAWEGWNAVGTVIGRIYPKSVSLGREAATGAQMTSLTQWYATLPTGTDVTAKDRLLYGSRTWEVTSVNNSEMWQTAVRCEVEAFNEEQRT